MKMRLASAETMRELDRMAKRKGISTLHLMENAGTAISKKTTHILKGLHGKRVAIFCGKGNNGGDGFVAARKFTEDKFEVDVFLLGDKSKVRNEAARSIRQFLEAGGRLQEIRSEADVTKLKEKFDYGLIIDAILGTGFSGSVSGSVRKVIDLINRAEVPVLSVDIPSGLDSTTGKVNPTAVKARWTLSFALPKKGFYLKDGPKYTGTVETVNIGFPNTLLKKALEFEKKLCRISK